MTPKTSEHVIAKADGEAVRVRTVRPVLDEDHWDATAVLAVRALPRKPNPNTAASDGAADQVEPQLNGEEAVRPEAGDSGAGIGRPDHDDAARGGPRELRLDGRLLEKFGYTPGCPGCINKQLGLDHRAHTAPCRTRVYNLMNDDEDEVDRLARRADRFARAQGGGDQAADGEGRRDPTPRSSRGCTGTGTKTCES